MQLIMVCIEGIDALSAFNTHIIPIILSYNDKFSFLVHEKHYYDTPKPWHPLRTNIRDHHTQHRELILFFLWTQWKAIIIHNRNHTHHSYKFWSAFCWLYCFVCFRVNLIPKSRPLFEPNFAHYPITSKLRLIQHCLSRKYHIIYRKYSVGCRFGCYYYPTKCDFDQFGRCFIFRMNAM